MINLIEDVSALTEVSENTLKKFIDVSNFVVGHAVYESMCEREEITDVDIGIGHIRIKQDENQLCYRFIPSKDLENVLIQTIVTHTSPMITRVDTKLQEKIDRAYKELL